MDDGGNSACSTWFDSSSSMFTSRVLLPPSAQLHHSIGCGTTDDHAVDCLRDSPKDRIALGRKRRLGRSAIVTSSAGVDSRAVDARARTSLEIESAALSEDED